MSSLTQSEFEDYIDNNLGEIEVDSDDQHLEQGEPSNNNQNYSVSTLIDRMNERYREPFINPVGLRYGMNGIIGFISMIIHHMEDVREDERHLSSMIEDRINLIREAAANNIHTVAFSDGCTLVVSEQDKDKIIKGKDIDDTYEMYDRLQNFRNEPTIDGDDMYNYLLKELFELKIIAICYKNQMEEWIENRLEKWSVYRVDMLEQIYTILQGIKL